MGLVSRFRQFLTLYKCVIILLYIFILYLLCRLDEEARKRPPLDSASGCSSSFVKGESSVSKRWGPSDHLNDSGLVDDAPFAPKNCVYEHLLAIDPTIATIPRSIICDVRNFHYDVICRWYLTQGGFTDHSECALPKPKTGNEVVPRIVYFVSFGSRQWTFLDYISVLSAWKNLGVSRVYVIGDQHPLGLWWRRTLEDVHGLRFVFRVPPKPAGILPVHNEHSTDVVRLQLLLMNGGIYLDTDVIVIRPVDELLDYHFSMGILYGNAHKMGNAVLLSSRLSTFLRRWYKSYETFAAYANSSWMSAEYFELSNGLPFKLWLQMPSSLHEISSTVYRPNWNESSELFVGNSFPWQKVHCVHVWRNQQYPVPLNPHAIRTLNTTLGQIFRFIYFGDPALQLP